ncbi:alkylglycerol monooxygenase-like [Panulirus ornatus]|uniref:alkylglycerol monooxygenase-like n=1 Tax=Panulirus ornatus TaxID=150431 RepID=UPI003A8AA81F
MNDTLTWDYRIRAIFYSLSPSETYIESITDVPNFVSSALPFIVIAVLVEGGLLRLYSPRACHLHYVVVNLSSGILTEIFKEFCYQGIEVTGYIWVFHNCRIGTLAWDSFYTYLLAITGVDFCYYWWHRASHEVAFMWAAHYIHHSSEQFDLSVAGRNSIFVTPFKWLYFLPLAVLGLPPSVFLVHNLLGYVWATWSHSNNVPKLGKVIPVLGDIYEFIFVTPSHHRVHHGTNKYALDKNYGQFLIIFDRMFGTYAEESEEEPVNYGTISQHKTFHIIGVQFVSWRELWQKVRSMDTIPNKLRALLYGPAWTPGKPRLGNLEDIPDVRDRKKTTLDIPAWISLYMVVHCVLMVPAYLELSQILKVTRGWISGLKFMYILATYTSLGGLYDGHLYTVWLEPARLLMSLGLYQIYPMLEGTTTITFTFMINVLSLILSPLLASFTRAKAKEADLPEARNGAVGREKLH